MEYTVLVYKYYIQGVRVSFGAVVLAQSSARSATFESEQGSTCVRDIHLYTTTNKCLQCLINIMYTVF